MCDTDPHTHAAPCRTRAGVHRTTRALWAVLFCRTPEYFATTPLSPTESALQRAEPQRTPSERARGEGRVRAAAARGPPVRRSAVSHFRGAGQANGAASCRHARAAASLATRTRPKHQRRRSAPGHEDSSKPSPLLKRALAPPAAADGRADLEERTRRGPTRTKLVVVESPPRELVLDTQPLLQARHPTAAADGGQDIDPSVDHREEHGAPLSSWRGRTHARGERPRQARPRRPAPVTGASPSRSSGRRPITRLVERHSRREVRAPRQLVRTERRRAKSAPRKLTRGAQPL